MDNWFKEQNRKQEKTLEDLERSKKVLEEVYKIMKDWKP